nr:hypothetical protein BaRGS_017728 [Batillaria attramentaria]
MDVGLQPGRLRAGPQDGCTTQDEREATSEWTWDCSLGDDWTEADQEQEVNRAAGQHPEKDCTTGQRQEMGDSVGYDKIGHADGHHPKLLDALLNPGKQIYED